MKIVSEFEDAKRILRAVAIGMCVAPENKLFSAVGGNKSEYLSICDATHFIIPMNDGKTCEIISPSYIVWNKDWILTSSIDDIRSVISNTLIPDLPKSTSVLTLLDLLNGARNTAFVDYYNANKGSLPDVELILAGKESNISALSVSHQVLVMCIVCSFLAWECDANPNVDAIHIPMAGMVGSVLSSLPVEVVQLSMMNTIGLDRVCHHHFDHCMVFDTALKAVHKSLSA